MKKQTLLLLLLLYSTTIVCAQVKFELRAPNVVGSGSRFRIEFVVSNSSVERFTPPTFTGVEVLAGPITSQGRSIAFANGVQSQTTTVTYTYTLQALSSSRISISAASAVVDKGKTMKTKATQIEVSANQGGGKANQSAAPQAITSSSILLRTQIIPSEVYQGQAVVASLVLYTQVAIVGFEDVKMPAFNGFWKQELDLERPEPKQTIVGGKVYESQIIKQWLIYPQRSGTLEIEQFALTAIAQISIGNSSSGGSLFDFVMGGAIPQVQHIRRKISTPALKIRVLPLPQPQPADFTGGVGKFEITGHLSLREIEANSGASVTIQLTGTGDLPLIDAPKLELPTAFEIYEPKPSEHITNTAKGSSGTRTWEYPFIARTQGDHQIQGVSMSYFDPSLRRYVTLTTPTLTLKVTQDMGRNSGNLVTGVTKEELKIINQDIRHIKTGDLRLKERGWLMLWSVKFFIIMTLIITAFVGTMIGLKKQIRNRQNVAMTKTKKANGVALRRLKKAKTHITDNDPRSFYDELLRALWGYMVDKLSISVAELSRDRLRKEFDERGFSGEDGEAFLELIADCEMAQYSPMANVEMNSVYEKSLELLGRFESAPSK